MRARRGRPPAPVGKRKGLTFSVTQLTAPGGPVTQSAPKWQVQTSLYSTDVLYCTEQYYCTCRVVDKLASEALSQATGYLGCLLCVPGMHRLDFDVVGSGTGTGSRLISKIKPERGASRRLLLSGG